MAVTGNIGDKFLNLLPDSIGVYQKNIGNQEEESLLYNPLPIYGKTYGDSVSSGSDSLSNALLSATATYENRKKAADEDTNHIVIVRLLSKKGDTLAEIVDSGGKLKSMHNALAPGVDAIYEWILTFKNLEA
jgi:hypothetical protein